MSIQNSNIEDIDFSDLLDEDVETNEYEDDYDEIENSDLNIDDNSDDDDEIIEMKDEVTPKKKRGRPRKNKMTIDVSDSSETNFITSDYATKLDSFNYDENNEYHLNQFDKMTLVYKRVIDPTGQNTKYFSTHCNLNNMKDDNGNLIYMTSNQLSKYYNCVNMEKLIDNIKNHITFNKETVYTSPFVCTWTGETQKSLKAIESQIEKDIFLIYSGFNPDKIMNVKNSNIDLYITNSYDGKTHVTVNFVMSFILEDSNGKVRNFKDYFTIREYKSKFLHKGIKINTISDSLSHIDNDISNDIEILKNTELTETDINNIATRMRKNKSKEFRQRMENIPPKYKNTYYSLLILSSIIQEDYKTGEHLNIEQIVSKIVNKKFKEYEKKKIEEEKALNV